MQQDTEIKWRQTDASTGQYGRQLTESIFEFKETNREQGTIDLTTYSETEKESCINAYGYTLKGSDKSHQNIKEAYGEDADFIIAECLYESNLDFDM